MTEQTTTPPGFAPDAVPFTEAALELLVNPEGDPLSIDPVDAALLAMATRRMKAAVHGNGMDPGLITLDGFDGAVINFDARSMFEIRHSVATKSVPGKVTNGEVVGTAGDMQARIKSTVEQTTKNNVVISHATEVLKKRKDKGFAVNNLVIKLDTLNKNFVHYNSCNNCSGAGKTSCAHCNGDGKIQCLRCRGLRSLNCPVCRGVGSVKQSSGQVVQCGKCHGRRMIPCVTCHQTGQTQCRHCAATGRLNCPKCNASGRISDLAYVSFDALTHFAYNINALPESVPPLIDHFGPAMATDSHADIYLLEGKEQQTWQQELRTQEKIADELIVPYHVRLPWGAIRFKVGDEIMDGELFGYHAELFGLPHFLDPLIAPAVERLQWAAGRLGSVRSNLEEAGRTKIIGMTLLAAATMTPPRAAATVRARYSVGIGEDTLLSHAQTATAALAQLTRRTRIGTLAAGAALSALLYAAWFLGPLRNALTGAVAVPAAKMGIDFILPVLCGAGITMAVQMLTRRSVLDIVGRFIPPERRGKFLPRAGKAGPLAWGCAFGAFALVLMLTFILGHGTPEWLARTLPASDAAPAVITPPGNI